MIRIVLANESTIAGHLFFAVGPFFGSTDPSDDDGRRGLAPEPARLPAARTRLFREATRCDPRSLLLSTTISGNRLCTESPASKHGAYRAAGYAA